MADRTSAVLCRARAGPVPTCLFRRDGRLPRFSCASSTSGVTFRKYLSVFAYRRVLEYSDSSATERKPARAKTRVGRV